MSSKSAAELRAEVKALRASHVDYQPVSKMKKSDLSGLLEKLKHNVETVPMMGQHQEKKVPKVPKDEVIKISKQMVAEDIEPKKAVKKTVKVKELISESSEDEKPKKAVKKSHVTKESHVTKKSHVKDDDEKKSKMKEKMAKIRAMKGKAKK